MHDLFIKVLSKRDLSRAGDLFSVADSEIVHDLSEVLREISLIISNKDYLQNSNDQSVIEICVSRVLSCIRETNTAERHCNKLVLLLETCLKNNLQPTAKGDPPHMKIASDCISSIFLNYNKKLVMQVALPVAVKFLCKNNGELSRNLASYLSLAAIEYSYLLSPHVQLILDSLLAGNYGLCRVLSQIYEISPEPINVAAPSIIEIIPRCDLQEKLVLLQLLAMVAKSKSHTVLHNSLPQLCDLLNQPVVAPAAMNVLLKLAENRPLLLIDHADIIKNAATTPQTVPHAAQILSIIGRSSKERAQIALDFVLEHLPEADRAAQTILLQQATTLCSQYPILFTDKVTSVIRQKNTQKSNSQIDGAVSTGTVTIVKLNHTPLPTNTVTPLALTKSQVAVINENAALGTTVTVNGASTSSSTKLLPLVLPTTSNNSYLPPPTYNQSFLVQNNYNSLMTLIGPNTFNVPHTTAAGSLVAPGPPIPVPVPPTPPHTGYTRRAKLGGDSRSTGRLHAGNTHRSMTKLNVAGGLHKSMTRLSSSQQINQNGLNANNMNCHSSGNMIGGNTASQNLATPIPIPPPLSHNVTITGENRWGIPSTKITSGGVTVTTSPPRPARPFSQGPNTLGMGSSGGLGLGKGSSSNGGLYSLNQSTGSIGVLLHQQQQNSISVHHASPASPTFNNNHPSQPVSSKMPALTPIENNNQVIVSGPATITSRRNDNKSVTLLNSTGAQRMSVFEPYPMRDTIQHFCEKHLEKIKAYMDHVGLRLPPPAKCTIEERRAKKLAKLHFACQARGPHCLYAKTFFTMRTRNPRTWIHLMFLDLQSRSQSALSSWDPSVSSLKHCWDTLKCENKTFITLVTSAFPNMKEQETLINELRYSGFFDVFELGNNSNGASSEDLQYQWGCFLCNHPEKAVGFLQSNNQPVIEGQLKEKKGKWRLFRRWRTRYFTLSGAHLSCKRGESIDVNQIRSVKVSRGARNIPKAFEIFTGDQTLILKPKDGKNAEEWVQCLSIVVAHSQARDNPTTKTNSLPARGGNSSRTIF